MKSFLITLALLPALPVSAGDQPVFELPAEELVLVSGGKHVVKVPVVNPGDAPLTLELKASDCGCMTATNKVVVQPGERSAVEVALDANHRKPGPFVRRLLFQKHKDPDAPAEDALLTLKSTIVEAPVEPAALAIGPFDTGTTTTVSIPVHPNKQWHATSAHIEGAGQVQIVQADTQDSRLVFAYDAGPADRLFSYALVVKLRNNVYEAECVYRTSLDVTVGSPVFKQPNMFIGAQRTGADSALVKSFPLAFSVAEIRNFALTAGAGEEAAPDLTARLQAGEARQTLEVRLRPGPQDAAGLHSVVAGFEYRTGGSKAFRRCEAVFSYIIVASKNAAVSEGKPAA